MANITVLASYVYLFIVVGLTVFVIWTIKGMSKRIKTLTELAEEKNWAEGIYIQAHDTIEVLRRLGDRKKLMAEALDKREPSDGALYALQSRTEVSTQKKKNDASKQDKDERTIDDASNGYATEKNIADAVRYRLSITDLFVEKAQYYLEHRARVYELLGYAMYSGALFLFIIGAVLASYKMLFYDPPKPQDADKILYVDLLSRFVLAFTGYGFLVLTGVASARGARACLDQRERLLAKRHSLRQGRLYLHLAGGHVTIDEMERAFNWNHSQSNAFTHMPTDTKAPWGAVLEEVVKITPELVKTGAAAVRGADESAKNNEKGK